MWAGPHPAELNWLIQKMWLYTLGDFLGESSLIGARCASYESMTVLLEGASRSSASINETSVKVKHLGAGCLRTSVKQN
jgi:hypothetical protein